MRLLVDRYTRPDGPTDGQSHDEAETESIRETFLQMDWYPVGTLKVKQKRDVVLKTDSKAVALKIPGVTK